MPPSIHDLDDELRERLLAALTAHDKEAPQGVVRLAALTGIKAPSMDGAREGFLVSQSVNQLVPDEVCAAIIAEAEERAARLGGWTSSRHSNYPTTDVPIQRLPMAHRWFRVGSQFSSWCASLPRTLTHAPHLDTVSARYRVPVPWYHDGPFSTNERRWRT